jgi:hypothetical protein
MYIRIEKCPHCGKMLDFDIRGGGPWNSNLGAKTIYHCPSCRGAISDGMMEWLEMDRVDRTVEIAWWSFFILIVAPLFGVLCAGLILFGAHKFFGLAFFDLPLSESFLPLGIAGVAFSLLALRRFIKEINASKRRAPEKVFGPSDPAHPDHYLWANREGPYAEE